MSKNMVCKNGCQHGREFEFSCYEKSLQLLMSSDSQKRKEKKTYSDAIPLTCEKIIPNIVIFASNCASDYV